MQGRRGLKVILDWPELMDWQGWILEWGILASLGSRGSLAAEARMGRMDSLVRMVSKEIQDLLGWMETKDLLERWAR